MKPGRSGSETSFITAADGSKSSLNPNPVADITVIFTHDGEWGSTGRNRPFKQMFEWMNPRTGETIASLGPGQSMKIAFLNSKSGTTLIEVMIALIIIALIILGGGMFFFYGRVNIIREAHRRAALLVASQRLEALKAANWEDIVLDPTAIPDPLNQPYYINHGSPWDRSLEEVRDTEVAVDNLSDGEMVTEAQWVDDDPDDGIDSYDYLEVTVTVQWTDSTTNTVSLTTLIAPR